MKKIIIILIIFISLSSIFAQTLVLPDSYTLETQEDFDSYEEKIIECINWYLAVPLDVEPEFRGYVKAFILIWLTENPAIHLSINQDVLLPVLKDEGYIYNDVIIFSYLSGMAAYIILNPELEHDPVDVQFAGVMASLILLERNMTILYGSRGLETYLLLENTEELRNWIANALSPGE